MYRFFAVTICTVISICLNSVAAQENETPAWLKKDVGQWKVEMKYWPNGPEGEPIMFEAIESNTLLGENWILSDFEGKFGDMPFKSHGIYGFDRQKNTFVGSWVDSANGFMSRYEGKRLEGSEGFELFGQEIDPTTGELVAGKQVRTVQDEKTRIVTSFQKPEGSDEFIQVMEMTLRKQDD